MNASPSAAATLSHCSRVSFGPCSRMNFAICGGVFPRIHRVGDEAPDGAAGHVLEDALPEVHRLQYVRRHVLVDVVGQVARPKHGVEPDRVEVDDLHGVASLAQPGGEPLQDRVTERLRLRMGVNGQNPHGPTR